MRIKMRGSFMSSRAFTLGLDPYIVTMAGSGIAASVVSVKLRTQAGYS